MLKIPPIKITSDKLLHIDLLRFISSTAIVYHHSHEFLISKSIRASATFTRTGGLALFVDLFFIVSGFVIAYFYGAKICNSGEYILFIKRRIGRLVPLHLLTLFIVICFYGILSLTQFSINNQPSTKILCIVNTALLLHCIIPCGNEIYFNGQSWSVSAEMVMYLFFPLFNIISNWRRWMPLAFSLMLIFSIFLQSSNSNVIYLNWEKQHAIIRAVPSFLFGIGLFNYRTTIAKLPRADFLFFIFMTAMIVAMIKDAPTLLTLIFIYLTVTSAIAADAQSVSPIVKKLAPLGQLTYSIYMWHGVLIMVIMNGIGDKLLHASGGLMIILTILCYVSVFIISYLSFFFIEAPARRWIDRL